MLNWMIDGQLLESTYAHLCKHQHFKLTSRKLFSVQRIFTATFDQSNKIVVVCDSKALTCLCALGVIDDFITAYHKVRVLTPKVKPLKNGQHVMHITTGNGIEKNKAYRLFRWKFSVNNTTIPIQFQVYIHVLEMFMKIHLNIELVCARGLS